MGWGWEVDLDVRVLGVDVGWHDAVAELKKKARRKFT